MTAAYEARITAQTLAQANAKPANDRTVAPAGLRAVAVPKTIGRETPKEQPGPKASTPLRWQSAGPLHTEQFPGEFRVVVTGAMPQLPVLLAALNNLARLQKDHPNIGY